MIVPTIVTATLAMAAFGLAGCSAPSSSSTSSPAPSPSGSPISGAVELRPVVSVVQPGDADAETMAARLGRDVFYEDRNHDGSFTATSDPLYLLGDAFVGTGDFAQARVLASTGGVDRWEVGFRLTAEAGHRLEAATMRAVGLSPPQDRIAVVVEDRVVSAPTVVEAIVSGAGVIPAGSHDEAQRIAELMLQG